MAKKPRTRTLYHLTSALHAQRILSQGFLKVTESNVSMESEHAGPDVVWLTRNPVPYQKWQTLSAVPKGSVRFTVKLPEKDVKHYPSWAQRQKVSPIWYAALAESGGNPDEWFVVERPIRSDEWVKIELTEGDQIIWSRDWKGEKTA